MMKLAAAPALDNVTTEAGQLWLMLDQIMVDDWVALSSLDRYLAPIARWMPLQSWRPLFHELGTHRLLAHRVNHGVIELSRWQNRCTAKPFDLAQSKTLRDTIREVFHDWTDFTWDTWQDILLLSDIETEALWQLNSIYIQCHAQNVIESRYMGKHVRAAEPLTSTK